MVDREDNFDEFLKQKVEESHFEFNEAYWLKAEKLIAYSQPKRKPFWWGFGLGMLSLALIGGVTAVAWQHNKDKSAMETMPQLVASSLVNEAANVNILASSASSLSTIKVTNASVKTDFTQATQKQSNSAVIAVPVTAVKNNVKQTTIQKGTFNQNRNNNLQNAPLTASINSATERSFSQVKNLTLPKLPESFITETDEAQNEEETVITIAEPLIIRAKTSSIKDIDVNVVAACENQNKHEWMFSVLAGVSDSRGFEGNTASNSKIGFGYFGGFRLAYKIGKNWFVGAQPLMYSRGAINTSVQTEKTAYDFGANADEFVVKNKALLFAELPVSIGYRVQRHQISLGAGIEYLMNVKSDVKEFGTTDYTPNQWGYTEGFNRLGTIAMFNYAFNVYNEFWITMMVQKGFTDMTKADYFTTNSKDKNLNLRIGVQYLFNNQNKKGK